MYIYTYLNSLSLYAPQILTCVFKYAFISNVCSEYMCKAKYLEIIYVYTYDMCIMYLCTYGLYR